MASTLGEARANAIAAARNAAAAAQAAATETRAAADAAQAAAAVSRATADEAESVAIAAETAAMNATALAVETMADYYTLATDTIAAPRTMSQQQRYLEYLQASRRVSQHQQLQYQAYLREQQRRQ